MLWIQKHVCFRFEKVENEWICNQKEMIMRKEKNWMISVKMIWEITVKRMKTESYEGECMWMIQRQRLFPVR